MKKTKLEAYMEQGGQIVMLLGYTDKATPNLDSLLGDYGIALADGLVLEGDSQHHLPNYPYYLLPDIQSSAYTSDVSSRYVLLAFAQGMTEAADISEDLTYESLLTTSANVLFQDQPGIRKSRTGGCGYHRTLRSGGGCHKNP